MCIQFKQSFYTEKKKQIMTKTHLFSKIVFTGISIGIPVQKKYYLENDSKKFNSEF